ncbi:MAG: FG-GAP repeat protein [Chitinophagaceae bacterium]|nr:FG-GAP repeat protein [Chitinophagaceae bacterium]
MNGISEYNPVADPAGETVDHFGFSVSISGNFAIIGTPYDDLTKGSASIYQYNGSNWVFMQKLTDATGVSGDLFGNSVSISGNYAIAGAPYATNGGNIYQGAVCIFQFNGSNWVLMQKITDPAGAAGDLFGSSVSVSGIYTVIGAVGDDELTADQGSASVYIYNGSSWLFMQKITDATGASTDFFGTSVSVSNNYIVIGAPSDVVGTNNYQGSASIYQYNGSSWVLMQKITDAGGAANDNFGSSVSISGNYVVMGAYYDNAGQGSVSFYQYNGSSWVLMQKPQATCPMIHLVPAFPFQEIMQ